MALLHLVGNLLIEAFLDRLHCHQIGNFLFDSVQDGSKLILLGAICHGRIFKHQSLQGQ